MRCDLHVHTIHSGMCTVPLLDGVCRESYNEPGEVYEVLKRRGMDLITVTDHDSIDAVEGLRRHPDFFLSEEVSCQTPSGTKLHMGVYGIEDRHHAELQRRSDDLMSLLAYLHEQDLFFSINHVFSSLTGPRTDADFTLFEIFFPGIETRNGQMLETCNRSAAHLASRWNKAPVAGSDAHTLGSLGLTYTEVAGATTKAEFLAGMRGGQAIAQGVSGDYWKLTQAVLEIGAAVLREKAWTAILTPLFLAVPLVTLGNLIREHAFEHKWSRRLEPTVCEASFWLGLYGRLPLPRRPNA